MGHTRVLATIAGAALGLGWSGALAQSTSQEITRDYASELMADAQGRKSLAGQGQEEEARGLVFGANGSTLNIRGQLDIRTTLTSRDAGDEDEDFTWGTELRRTKLIGEGDLNNTWSYKVQMAFDRGDGSVVLEDVWAEWKFDDNWSLFFGQFKVPTLREELISSTKQQAADRSLMNELHNLDRTQGFLLNYDSEQFDLSLTFNDGPMTANTTYDSPAESDLGVGARGRWNYSGNKKQLDDLAGWQNQAYAGGLGAAFHYSTGGSTGGPTMDQDFWQVTIDNQSEGSGWNIFAAFVWSHLEPDVGDDVDTFGIVLQGGWFIAQDTEIFARWDCFQPDSDSANDDFFNTLTAGLNYYFIPESHASKLQIDVQVFIDDPADSDGVTPQQGIGFLPTADSGEITLRVQYQLLF
jgi:hypothetical protein